LVPFTTTTTTTRNDEAHGREALGVRTLLTKMMKAANDGDLTGLKKVLKEENSKHPDVSIEEMIR